LAAIRGTRRSERERSYHIAGGIVGLLKRNSATQETADERILGGGKFVESLLKVLDTVRNTLGARIGKREEGRGKREEGRGKREEGRVGQGD
jgi:hypothetical protein